MRHSGVSGYILVIICVDVYYSTVMPKTVVITGCASGIGRETAQLFLARGWNVAATARNPAMLADLPQTENTAAFQLDVTDETSIAGAVSATIERFGAIDVLVNNAGYGLFRPPGRIERGAVGKSVSDQRLWCYGRDSPRAARHAGTTRRDHYQRVFDRLKNRVSVRLVLSRY